MTNYQLLGKFLGRYMAKHPREVVDLGRPVAEFVRLVPKAVSDRYVMEPVGQMTADAFDSTFIAPRDRAALFLEHARAWSE